MRYGRDSAGAVTGIADTGGASVSYSYDAFGRMTSATDSGVGRTISYAYDRRGLRTGLSVPFAGSTASINYTYDGAMRLRTVLKSGETSPSVYSYDTGGRRMGLTLPNGVTTSYAYDANDRLDVLVSSRGFRLAVPAGRG